ncbi:MAG: hypothetical protein ACKOGH_09595 [Alphaproteobacteria bacterium]
MDELPSLHAIALGAILLARLAEAWMSRLNGDRMAASGAVEVAHELHVWTQLFHACWLGALVVLVDRAAALDATWSVAGVLLLLSRAAALWRVRGTWTLRRFEERATPDPWTRLRDPDGASMLSEVLVLPLAFGLPWLSAVGALAYAPPLARRCGFLAKRA